MGYLKPEAGPQIAFISSPGHILCIRGQHECGLLISFRVAASILAHNE